MAPTAPADPARDRLDGYLRLTCASDAAGRSRLLRKAYRAPIHIGKPYWDGHALLLNVMSPTAGMLGGDTVEIEVLVKSEASLVLSNPSSLRVHKMDASQEAVWRQGFTVESGGFLESNPEWLIPQGESAFVQESRIDIAQGGELFFIEAIAPGRVAHGEAFLFRSFKNRLELRFDGRLAASEKHCLEPKRNTHLGWISDIITAPFYVSIYMVSSRLLLDSPFWDTIYAMQSEHLRIGSSQLAEGPCWNVKLLASSAPLARKAVEAIRQQFYEIRARPCPKLRRQ